MYISICNENSQDYNFINIRYLPKQCVRNVISVFSLSKIYLTVYLITFNLKIIDITKTIQIIF